MSFCGWLKIFRTDISIFFFFLPSNYYYHLLILLLISSWNHGFTRSKLISWFPQVPRSTSFSYFISNVSLRFVSSFDLTLLASTHWGKNSNKFLKFLFLYSYLSDLKKKKVKMMKMMVIISKRSFTRAVFRTESSYFARE